MKNQAEMKNQPTRRKLPAVAPKTTMSTKQSCFGELNNYRKYD